MTKEMVLAKHVLVIPDEETIKKHLGANVTVQDALNAMEEYAELRMRQTLSAVPSVIKQLMGVLPDSDGEDFDWCWNELSDKSQERVQAARKLANELLKNLERGIAG